MSLRKTLFLGLVLAAAVLIIFRADLNHKHVRGEDYVFRNFKIDELESIVISRPPEDFMLVSPEGKNWKLAGLLESELDQGEVNNLLFALRDLRAAPVFEDDPLSSEDSILETMGLKEPELRLTLNWRGGFSEVLHFGAFNDFLQKRYIKLSPHNRILMSEGDALFSAAKKDRNNFRLKTPVNFSDFEVTSVSIQSDDYRVRLAFQREENHIGWRILEPGPFIAGEEAVSGLLQNIRSLRIFEFIDGEQDTSLYGFSDPMLEIRLDFDQASRREPIVLTFGSPDNENFYFMREDDPAIFKMLRDPLSLFVVAPEDLRETNILKFSTAAVSKAEFGGTLVDPLVLERLNGAWTVNEKVADTPFVEQLLENLLELEVSGYAEMEDGAGFGSESLRVVLSLRDQEQLVLTVGEMKAGGHYYARVSGIDEVFLLGQESLRRIMPREETLLLIDDEVPDA